MAQLDELVAKIEDLEGQIEYHITRPWLCLTREAQIVALIEEQDSLIEALNALRKGA